MRRAWSQPYRYGLEGLVSHTSGLCDDQLGEILSLTLIYPDLPAMAALDRLTMAITSLPRTLLEEGFPLVVAGLGIFRLPLEQYWKGDPYDGGFFRPLRLRGMRSSECWRASTLVALVHREGGLAGHWGLTGHPYLRLTLMVPYGHSSTSLLEGSLKPLLMDGQLDLTLMGVGDSRNPNPVRRALLHPLGDGRLEELEGLSPQLTALREVYTPRFGVALTLPTEDPLPSWLETLCGAWQGLELTTTPSTPLPPPPSGDGRGMTPMEGGGQRRGTVPFRSSSTPPRAAFSGGRRPPPPGLKSNPLLEGVSRLKPWNGPSLLPEGAAAVGKPLLQRLNRLEQRLSSLGGAKGPKRVSRLKRERRERDAFSDSDSEGEGEEGLKGVEERETSLTPEISLS